MNEMEENVKLIRDSGIFDEQWYLTEYPDVLTLGLISFIVNGLLLLLVAWISDLMGFGLEIDGFWWGVLGALVLGLISWLVGLVVRPSRD